VEEIAAARADIANLRATTAAIRRAIAEARRLGERRVVFVTGVPGAGKTLCGLTLVLGQQAEEGAAFLTGNPPLVAVLRNHGAILGLATLAAVTTFVVFYLMTVFTLSWGTSQLGFVRQDFLILQIISVIFFGLTIPLSAKLADRFGRVEMRIAATLLIIVFGLAFGPLFSSANSGRVLLMLSLGLACMGLTYGPLGTTLAAVFPTSVRYTGASLAFNLAGILGGSLAPYIATWLAGNYGIAAVGYYLCGAGTVSLVALLLIKRRGS
jgi:MFS family permease